MDFPPSKPLPPIGGPLEEEEETKETKETEDPVSTETDTQDSDRSKEETKEDDRDDDLRSTSSSRASSNSKTGGKNAPRALRRFRPEINASSDVEIDSEEETKKSVIRQVSFREMKSGRKSPTIKSTRINYDGQEITMVTLETQTDWSWVQDMHDRSRPGTASGMDSAETQERLGSGLLGADLAQPDSQSDGVTPGPSSYNMPYSDEFGIPLLDLSSDTDDSSDEETSTRKTKDDRNFMPSVGPPQILQYNRESQKKLLEGADPDEAKDALAKTEGMLGGDCEFCQKPVKPFPTLEQQLQYPPEYLYCCNQYRDFVEFILKTTSSLEDEEQQNKKMIDIKPHQHHGSKKERYAAKEKAAQKMREREQQRRVLEASGMQQNFFQSGGLGAKFRVDGSAVLSMKDMLECLTNCPASSCGVCRMEKMKVVQDPAGFLSVPRIELEDRCEHSCQHTSECAEFKNKFFAIKFVTVLKFARQMKTINYQLSSQKCMDEGWTLRVPSPLLMEDGAEVFEPEPLNPAIGLQDRPLVEKFYEGGQKFLTIFPDGTGNVFYPSGNLAILIASVKLGQYYYTIHEDIKRSEVIASFDPDGHGYCYFPNGSVRLYIDQYGGIEMDVRGGRKKKWQWKDNITHVHAPPFQPICMGLGMHRHLGLRVMSQDYITVTFSAKQRSCRFNMGSRLKVVAPDNVPIKDIDEEHIFLEEKKANVDTLLNKVAMLLKFPNSPKIDKILPPIHVTAKIQKTDKLKSERKVIQEARAARYKKQMTVPVT